MGAFCSGSPYIGVALWRWDRGEPVPDARLVVCAPGPLDGAARRDLIDATREGLFFVWSVENADRLRHLVVKERIIHALHARTQADLDGRACPVCVQYGSSNDPSYTHLCGNCNRTGYVGGLRALVAVQAERRALVLSPTEPIDFGVDMESTAPLGLLACSRCGGQGVVLRSGTPTITGAEDERTCPVCDGARTPIDLVIVAGFDEPLHPEHVRSAVEQCRAAGVPVVFAGWGEWVPTEVVDPTTTDDVMERLIGEVGWMVPVRYVGDRWHARVGATRSGALLDGEPVADLPEWVSA